MCYSHRIDLFDGIDPLKINQIVGAATVSKRIFIVQIRER